jgi:hypothetical protein
MEGVCMKLHWETGGVLLLLLPRWLGVVSGASHVVEQTLWDLCELYC